MPTIPKYERRISPQGSSMGLMQADMQVANATVGMGKAVAQAGQVIQQVSDKINDLKDTNELMEKRTEAAKLTNEYKVKRAESQDPKEWSRLDSEYTESIRGLGATENKRIGNRLKSEMSVLSGTTLADQSIRDIGRLQEKARIGLAVAKENFIHIASIGSETDIENARRSFMQSLNDVATQEGFDGAWMTNEFNKADNLAIKSRISSIAMQDPGAAATLLDAQKGTLAASDRVELGNFIKAQRTKQKEFELTEAAIATSNQIIDVVELYRNGELTPTMLDQAVENNPELKNVADKIKIAMTADVVAQEDYDPVVAQAFLGSILSDKNLYKEDKGKLVPKGVWKTNELKAFKNKQEKAIELELSRKITPAASAEIQKVLGKLTSDPKFLKNYGWLPAKIDEISEIGKKFEASHRRAAAQGSLKSGASAVNYAQGLTDVLFSWVKDNSKNFPDDPAAIKAVSDSLDKMLGAYERTVAQLLYDVKFDDAPGSTTGTYTKDNKTYKFDGLKNGAPLITLE